MTKVLEKPAIADPRDALAKVLATRREIEQQHREAAESLRQAEEKRRPISRREYDAMTVIRNEEAIAKSSAKSDVWQRHKPPPSPALQQALLDLQEAERAGARLDLEISRLRTAVKTFEDNIGWAQRKVDAAAGEVLAVEAERLFLNLQAQHEAWSELRSLVWELLRHLPEGSPLRKRIEEFFKRPTIPSWCHTETERRQLAASWLEWIEDLKAEPQAVAPQ